MMVTLFTCSRSRPPSVFTGGGWAVGRKISRRGCTRSTAHLARPVALQFVGTAEHHVAEALHRLELLKALTEALRARLAVRPAEREPAVAEPGQPLGLKEDLHLPPASSPAW